MFTITLTSRKCYAKHGIMRLHPELSYFFMAISVMLFVSFETSKATAQAAQLITNELCKYGNKEILDRRKEIRNGKKLA